MSDLFNVQLYSRKELPRFLKLAGDPYDLSWDCKDQFQYYGIFFWRDEKHANGVVIDAPTGLTPSFYSQAIWDEEFHQVDEWEETPPKQKEQYADPYSWIIFNRQVVVVHTEAAGVTCQKI